MTFKEKVTAKEQYQVLKETWEKKSLELTTENLIGIASSTIRNRVLRVMTQWDIIPAINDC